MNISVSHYISNTYNNPHFAFFTCGKISFLAETSKYFSKKIHKHIIIYKIARIATRKRQLCAKQCGPKNDAERME